MKIKTNTSNRKELVNKLVQETGFEAKYLGAPSFIYQIGPYTVDRQGDIEVEDSEADKDLLRSFSAEEVITDDWQENEDALAVSVPLKGHTVQSIINLLHTFCSREKLLNRSVGCSYNFLMNKKFIKALDDKVPETIEEFYERLEAAGGTDTNRGISFEEDRITVSFPYTEDPDTVKAYTELVSLINTMALSQKRVVKDKYHATNEKYAFRCWLVRLGMIGDEYKVARKVLLKNMPGNSAFRTEDQKEAALEKLKSARKEAAACSEYQTL